MGTLVTERHNHFIMIPFQIIKWHTCSPNPTILAETVYLKIPYINVSFLLGTSQGLEECFWELGFEQNMVWDSGKCKIS